MKTAVDNRSAVPAGRAAAGRLVSIDVLRGLTMAVMIFVNELAGVRGLPWWTYHAKAQVDAMTYVDMVFPFFLFVVGLSLPLAIASRLRRNPSMPALWGHVALRTGSLLTVGLILANAEGADATRMALRPAVWTLVALTGAALFLNEYGNSARYTRLHHWLRVTGLAMVAAMLAMFRHTPHPGAMKRGGGWIDFSYPEILGLIGFTYFAVALLYIPVRRWRWAPLACFLAMVALNGLSAARWITFPRHVPYYFWPFSNGAMASITFAGVVTSVIFLGAHRWQSIGQKIGLGISFAVLCLAGGWALTPLGISKIRATPAWSLYSIGAAVLAFTALYWLCDIKKAVRWAFFIRPAGSNPLTTYLLPDFWDYLLAAAGLHYLDTHFDSGALGVMRSVVFTALMLTLSAVLTRMRVRLRL